MASMKHLDKAQPHENYHIDKMSRGELNLAIEWAAKEGWNPGLYDAQCFYQTDPNGFFAGKLNDQIIAVGSAVIYDSHFAFCGFYIVHPQYRHQGYGLALTQKRLAYVAKRNVGIDGVLNMVSQYAKIGYEYAHQNARYTGQLNLKASQDKNIVSLAKIDFTELTTFDRLHFPAPRERFLKCWITQPDSKSLGYVEKNKLRGYGVIRPCQQGFKIGPLFSETPEIAHELFLSLVAHTNGQPFSIDIPECNSSAISLATHHQLKKVFATARMYLRQQPDIILENIYGITSFELG